MNIVANAKPASFFDDIPPRAMPAVQLAWKEIRTPGNVFGSEAVFAGLCGSASQNDFTPPSRPEFLRWFKGVRAGDVPRPGGHELEEVAAAYQYGEERARNAHAIILHATKLQQAMIDAGYSPDSVEMEDQIIALAVKEWLELEAGNWGRAMNLTYSPAEVAMAMLDADDRDQSAKLLDVFATHMQRELCLAIAAQSQEGGAA